MDFIQNCWFWNDSDNFRTNWVWQILCKILFVAIFRTWIICKRTIDKHETGTLFILAKTFSENCFRRYWTQSGQTERIIPQIYHFRKNLSFTYINTFSNKASQKIFDQIKSGRKNCFFFWAKTFSEKSFQTLSDRIGSDGKNCFSP